jgi:hypothetical protein
MENKARENNYIQLAVPGVTYAVLADLEGFISVS